MLSLDPEKLEPLSTGGNSQQCRCFGKKSGGSSKSFTQLSYDSAIPLVGTCPRELKICSHKTLYTNVYSSIIHKSRSPPPDERTHKTWSMHTKKQPSVMKGTRLTHGGVLNTLRRSWTHVVWLFIRNVQNQRTHRHKAGLSLPGFGGRKQCGVTNTYWVSFRGDEDILRLDSGDGFTTLWMSVFFNGAWT